MDDTEHGHPRSIMAELERRDADPALVRAIASHADFMGVAARTPMEKTLFAVDELSGSWSPAPAVRPRASTA
jgi:predicted hydrolase (HD superfamily)